MCWLHLFPVQNKRAPFASNIQISKIGGSDHSLVHKLIDPGSRMRQQSPPTVCQFLHPLDPTVPPTVPIRRHPLPFQILPIQSSQKDIENLVGQAPAEEICQIGAAAPAKGPRDGRG